MTSAKYLPGSDPGSPGRSAYAGPERYEGPLEIELAAMDERRLADALLAVVHAIDDAYWAFSRQARGRPVSEALYVRRRWLVEAARRMKAARAAEGG